MPKPLFEVKNLRIAVADDHQLVRGGPGPTTEDGEVLPSGWVEVLVGVSYSVDEGEVLALVGESASGKSLMLLGPFALLSSGSRVIGGTVQYRGHEYKPFYPFSDDESIAYQKERDQRRIAGTAVAMYTDEVFAELVGSDIGFLFQNPIGSWTPDIPIGEQSGESLEMHTDLSEEEIQTRVLDALGEVDLPKSGRLLRAFRHELSRGMAQRAMLAAALTKAPHLMIADEPLNGLDAPSAASILELLKDMRDRRGMAMVLVSHDLAAVAGIADRVAVVYGGQIVETAPVVDIYHRPKHPYTSGLIGSIPSANRSRLRHMKGEAPNLVDISHSGCSFAPRCPFATDICREVDPPPTFVETSEVRCHHAAKIELPGIDRRNQS